ncbi:amidase [Embleya hyalina]|uniref:Glutamyl-tRNA amidotransferase subunit A n=1 Tax=Embleya hyalina TaxID=516124 RepID=A0A401YKQ0_9ACTN|nr:amidase [Embleya hyalina]GCD95182.1 glutamyl-tRNA amidotransferase subunit A [Embleya hyalina]
MSDHALDELAYLPATEALRRFRDRSLSPVELMNAVITRAEAVEPVVNCLAERMYDEALAAAREAEARYAGKGDAPRPLEGLAVATKEEQPIAGRIIAEGSLPFATEIAETTHPVVERVMAAGGIVHARTTTPEFSCAAFTDSKLWGVTRNPWNPAYSPGGSSGGAGAALAAGSTTLATGSDIGGSIRIPASFTGTVGYKPPYGRVPALPPFNLDTYCHDGPMTRTVADCVLLQNVIAGPHPLDGVALSPKLTLPTVPGGVAGLRVALSIGLGDWQVDPEVEANTRAVADALREAGAIVEEVAVDIRRRDVMDTAMIHFGAIFGSWVRGVANDHGDQLNAYTLRFAEETVAVADRRGLLSGLEREAAIQAEIGGLLDRYDVLLCPTAGIPAFLADDDYTSTKVTINGVELEHYLEASLTTVFNIASRCPVLSVPSGRAANGVPTGVQIVGRFYDDATVFRVAAAVERVRPWDYAGVGMPGR